MEWWMWLIIIYYSVPQVVLSVKMLGEDDYRSDGYHYMSPKYIYEEFDDLNWVGAILLWIICFILFPGVYIAYFLEWIFTVGRK